MSFDDLPDDAPDRPLTEPKFVADVLDLVVSEQDRRDGALAVLLCDEQSRLRVPVVVRDVDGEVPQAERDQVLARIVELLQGSGALLVAVARRDGLSARPGDHAWARAAVRACTGGTRLLGVHVITLQGSRELPAESAA